MPLAEIDLGQVIIVVIAMVAGFVQWLIGLLKQSQEARERRAASPSPGAEAQPGEEFRPPAPRPAAPPPVHDPWGGMREIFEQLKPEPSRQPAAPARVRRQPRAAAAPTPAVAVVSPAPAPAPVPVAQAAAVAPPPSADPLLAFLRQPDALRQAVVLREVLGPPKALQSPDSAAC